MDAEQVFAEIVAERAEKAKQAPAEPEIRGVRIGRPDGRFLFWCFPWPSNRRGERNATVQLRVFDRDLAATFAMRHPSGFGSDKQRLFFRPTRFRSQRSVALQMTLFRRRWGVTLHYRPVEREA